MLSNIKKSKERYNLKTEYLLAKRIVIQEKCGNPDIVLVESLRQVILLEKGDSLVSEAMGSIGYKNATNGHSVRDTVVNLMSTEQIKIHADKRSV